MIFKKTPITENEILVRFHYWQDPNKGWGDAGTFKYMKIPIEKFDVREEKDFSGEPYYNYSLNTEYGEEVLGEYWWMEYGYDMVSPEAQQNEINKLKEKLKRISQ